MSYAHTARTHTGAHVTHLNRQVETGGGLAEIPDPLEVENLVVTDTATIEHLDVNQSIDFSGDVAGAHAAFTSLTVTPGLTQVEELKANGAATLDSLTVTNNTTTDTLTVTTGPTTIPALSTDSLTVTPGDTNVQRLNSSGFQHFKNATFFEGGRGQWLSQTSAHLWELRSTVANMFEILDLGGDSGSWLTFDATTPDVTIHKPTTVEGTLTSTAGVHGASGNFTTTLTADDTSTRVLEVTGDSDLQGLATIGSIDAGNATLEATTVTTLGATGAATLAATTVTTLGATGLSTLDDVKCQNLDVQGTFSASTLSAPTVTATSVLNVESATVAGALKVQRNVAYPGSQVYRDLLIMTSEGNDRYSYLRFEAGDGGANAFTTAEVEGFRTQSTNLFGALRFRVLENGVMQDQLRLESNENLMEVRLRLDNGSYVYHGDSTLTSAYNRCVCATYAATPFSIVSVGGTWHQLTPITFENLYIHHSPGSFHGIGANIQKIPRSPGRYRLDIHIEINSNTSFLGGVVWRLVARNSSNTAPGTFLPAVTGTYPQGEGTHDLSRTQSNSGTMVFNHSITLDLAQAAVSAGERYYVQFLAPDGHLGFVQTHNTTWTRIT